MAATKAELQSANEQLIQVRLDTSKAEAEHSKLTLQLLAQLSTAQSNVATSGTTIERLTQKLILEHEKYDARMGLLTDKLTAIEIDKATLTEQLEAQAIRLDASQAETRDLNVRLDALSNENNRLTAAVASSGIKNVALEKTVAAQRVEIDTAKGEAGTLTISLQAAQAENVILHDESKQLSVKNANLLSQITALTQAEALAKDKLERMMGTTAGMILDSFTDRIAKAQNVLTTKSDLLGETELKNKIIKHQLQVDKEASKWSTITTPTEAEKRQFTALTSEWDTIKIGLDEKLRVKKLPTPPPPTGLLKPLPAAPLATVRATSSSPAVNKWGRIYAEIDPAKAKYANKELFKASHGGTLMALNMHEEKELSPENTNKFISETGLNVTSPSGHQYSFSCAGEVPKALLMEAGVTRVTEDTPEQHQQRLAITIMNMIENTLSKGTTVNINSRDPFLAKTATLYIHYLRHEMGLLITQSDVAATATATDSSAIDAERIFGQLTSSVLKPNLEKAPWFIEAQNLREPLVLASGSSTLKM